MPGQRLPRHRRDKGRPERWERREKERIEAARRKFEEEVRQSQKRLERWAKEGSEPRTPKERAVRAILKFWELWGEVSSNWDATHKKFESMVSKRINLAKDVPALAKGKVDLIDKDIVRVFKALQELDSHFFDRITKWEAEISQWREEVDFLAPGTLIKAIVAFVTRFFEYMAILSELEQKRTAIDAALFKLEMDMTMLMPLKDWRPPPPTIREAD